MVMAGGSSMALLCLHYGSCSKGASTKTMGLLKRFHVEFADISRNGHIDIYIYILIGDTLSSVDSVDAVGFRCYPR